MSKNTIKLKKYLDIIEEYTAADTIKPGMLLEFDSDGKVNAHQVAGGNALPAFALEDEMQGNGIDDEYSADDKVQVWVTQRGEQVYAILKDDENVDEGDFLVSAGNGELQELTAYEDADSLGAAEGRLSIVAQALEAVDLSDSSGTWPESRRRIKVRIV